MRHLGFIQAVYDQGVLARRTSKSINSELSSYLQLPMPVITDEKKSGREIRVWLSVENTQADMLIVRNIDKLDIVEYPKMDKEKYLYRKPVSTAATWGYTPVYKLGKGEIEGRKKLIGIGDEHARVEMYEWLRGKREAFSSESIKKKITENRLYKIKNALLDAFEKEQVFAPGAVNIIMSFFLDNVDGFVTEYWMDKNRSYIIIFGVVEDGRFLYPGEIPAFRKHFWNRLRTHVIGESIENTKQQKVPECTCAICGEQTGTAISIDKLFVFATFDKTNFLPGSRGIPGAKEKVYPLCQKCFSICSEGRERIKEYFRDSQTVIGLNIDIVPELIFGIGKLDRISDQTGLFLHKGITGEQYRYNRLAELGEGLVYHFSFWEQIQNQERIHLLIEDVPPTRLKHLLQAWQETNRIFYVDREDATLDHLFKLMFSVLLALAGKRDEDKKTMRDRWVQMMGKLLGGQAIDVLWLKALVVSRFPGLFADQEWVRRFGSSQVKSMQVLVDFLERVKGR